MNDFFFEDGKWGVRYFVVKTNKWLPGRHVLVYPFSAEKPDWENKKIPVNLTKDAIKNSPPIDADEPISRKKEKELFVYFKWDPYWAATDPAFNPEMFSNIEELENEPTLTEKEEESYLRSFNEIVGYRIEAKNQEETGHLEDMIVDDDNWIIRYIVADVNDWRPGGKVILSAGWIDNINWKDNRITMNLEDELIKNSPEYDPTIPINRKQEEKLFNFYGKPEYWEEKEKVK